MSNSESQWHLDKKVSIGQMVATATAVIAFVVWLQTIQSRVGITEFRVEANTQSIENLRADQAQQYNEIIRRLERLDKKLDDTRYAP